MRVGKIVEVEQHADADSLFVRRLVAIALLFLSSGIDIGETFAHAFYKGS